MKVLLILLVVFTLLLPHSYSKAENDVKFYGIVIADEKGVYTFYDLNDTTINPCIEVNSDGNVMVPLKELCELMPNLTYEASNNNKNVTVMNTLNNRKVMFTKNSKYCYYYNGSKTKGSKKSMTAKMYVSKNTYNVYVHMSALKWVMNSNQGFSYYKVIDMQKAGYDTSKYSGLIVYNSYSDINAIPKSTTVEGISKTVKVTIPEGYTVTQIVDLLVSKGVCASTDFLYDALENYDYSYYPLVKEIDENVNRAFRLEGYLYPDTYEFYRLSKGADVIGKFLRNAENKITKEDREKADSLGLSMNELLTIASLIQKETGDKNLMPNVASVIFNRLNQNMRLQLDATINYIEKYVKPKLTSDVDRYNIYYNTYKCLALPAGPICNPGLDAIQAALNPAITEYLFFYSDEEGEYYFTNTFEEMLAIRQK
jgi:UPF0755 protein